MPQKKKPDIADLVRGKNGRPMQVVPVDDMKACR